MKPSENIEPQKPITNFSSSTDQEIEQQVAYLAIEYGFADEEIIVNETRQKLISSREAKKLKTQRVSNLLFRYMFYYLLFGVFVLAGLLTMILNN